MKTILKLLSVLTMGLVVFLSPTATAASLEKPFTLRIGAQAPGLTFYGYSMTIAKLVEQYGPPGSKVEVFPRGGSMSNPTTLDQGRCELAFCETLPAMWAWTGLDDVYGTHGPHKNIRFLTPGRLNNTYWTIAARREYVQKTGFDNFEKMLLAKTPPRIVMKPQGSMVPPMFAGFARSVGKTFDELKAAGSAIQVPQAQFSEMLRDGRVDVYVDNVPPGHPGFVEIDMTNDLVWVPPTERMLKYMNENMSGMIGEIPKGTYASIDKNVPTIVGGQCLLVHKDVPDEVAYFLAKLLVENKAILGDENGSLRDWDPETMHDTLNLAMPIHPGAAKYYKEKGWMK